MDSSGPEFDDHAFESEIQKQAAYWQDILALRDWAIGIRVCRHWEMEDHTAVAQCEVYLDRKDAIISVLHPTDLLGLTNRFLNGEEADYDISLVHELLHLHFAPFDTDDAQHEVAYEQAINAISRGIVRLYRTPPPMPASVPPQAESGYL